MRLAYADPPYLGQCGKHYRHRHDPPWGCWNELDSHRALVDHLATFDGWALSTGSSQLQAILSVCPAGVRVAAWVKPWASFKVNINPGYCWEPVVFSGNRRRHRDEPTVRDFYAGPATTTVGLVGAKPELFCHWVLALLGYRDGDELTDLFPGSGAMSRAAAQQRLDLKITAAWNKAADGLTGA